MHNYSTYVISLAIADLLVGVIVLPLCFVSFYVEYMTPQVLEESTTISFSNFTTQQPDNITASKHELSTQVLRVTSANNEDRQVLSQDIMLHLNQANNRVESPLSVSRVIKMSLGFCTHLTLFVSMYTIVVASADRFYAATHAVQLRTKRRSFRYNLISS